jgi:hypothetical protein
VFVEVDDLVLHESGFECRVTDSDFERDAFTVVTPSGLLLEYFASDLELMSEPPLGDREGLEQWLRVRYRLVPRIHVNSTTTRCDRVCTCRHCYIVEQTRHRNGQRLADHIQHFTDNGACSCVRNACGCIR